jgi:hypothetical protein
MTPQHPPVRLESLDKPPPVNAGRTVCQQVGYVRSVKSFPLHDVCLLPNQLFEWSYSDPHPKDVGFSSLLEPDVVDCCQSISGGKNDINARPSRPDFCQPMSEFKVRFVTGLSPDGQRGVNVGWAKQQIEIFRVTSDSGIMSHRISTSNQELEIVFDEELHHRFVSGVQPFGFHCLKCAPGVQCAPMLLAISIKRGD